MSSDPRLGISGVVSDRFLAMTERFVVVATTATPQEAQLVVAVLAGAGILAIVEGASLFDGWAVTQRALGQLASEVKVPIAALREAQDVLSRARAKGAELFGPDAGLLEVEPTDEALTPSYVEGTRYVQKPTYNIYVVLAAVLATGILLWILMVAFKLLPTQ